MHLNKNNFFLKNETSEKMFCNMAKITVRREISSYEKCETVCNKILTFSMFKDYFPHALGSHGLPLVNSPTQLFSVMEGILSRPVEKPFQGLLYFTLMKYFFLSLQRVCSIISIKAEYMVSCNRYK